MNQDIQEKLNSLAIEYSKPILFKKEGKITPLELKEYSNSIISFFNAGKEVLKHPELMKEAMIDLIGHIKNYGRESGQNIGYDDRSEEDLFELYIKHLESRKPPVSTGGGNH